MVAKGKTFSRHVMGFAGLPKYVFHPELERAEVGNGLLSEVPELMKSKAPPHGDAEVTLFKAMHYCAYRAHQARGQRMVLTVSARRWTERRNEIRDHLISVNLGLSYEMLRHCRVTNVDEDELLSESLRALFDAVEAFDPWRGYRFSTYACNAIYRGFLRLSKLETRRASVISLGFDTRMERGGREDDPFEWDTRVYVERLNQARERNTAGLTSTEQYILNRRFPEAPDSKRDTLETIGRDMRVSKEHVRQIQVTALEKLRRTIVAEPILC